MDYATADGDAVKGDDYQETTGRLTFEPGDTSQTVSVPIVDDGVEDGGETFTLTLSDAVGATIASGKGTATGTINNHEAGEEAALTAEFVGMPSEHDGTEFTFRVRFSEDPAVSYKVLESAEDGAFEVGGGTITRSKRVNGQHDLRDIYVEPSGVGDVTIELAGRRACGTAGAICTADGKVLSNHADGDGQGAGGGARRGAADGGGSWTCRPSTTARSSPSGSSSARTRP